MEEDDDVLFKMDSFGLRSFEDSRFFESCSCYLREIELQLNENIDFNKEKYKIQSLFNKFKDFQWTLLHKYKNNKGCIKLLYGLLRNPKLNEEEIFHYKSLIQKLKINQASALEIIKRKEQVEKRLKELGM
jgi:hypothetical protein